MDEGGCAGEEDIPLTTAPAFNFPFRRCYLHGVTDVHSSECNRQDSEQETKKKRKKKASKLSL